MNLNRFNIRKILEVDINQFIDFWNKAHSNWPNHYYDIDRNIAIKYLFKSPKYDPDRHYLVFNDDKIVGSAIGNITPNHGTLTILISPEYQNIGLENELFSKLVPKFEQLNVNEIRTTVPLKFMNLNFFYESKEFSIINHTIIMSLNPNEIITNHSEIPGEHVIRPVSIDIEKNVILNLINESFSSNSPHLHMTNEQLDDILRLQNYDPSGFLVAYNVRNEMVGSCINLIHPSELSKGFVFKLAVKPNEMNKRIGTNILEASLQWFKEKEVKEVIMHITSDNVKNSLNIYERLGFKHTSKMLTLSKVLNQVNHR